MSEGRWIHASKLIPILQELVTKHGAEVGVEVNLVSNLLISDEYAPLGYIDLRSEEYHSFGYE